MFCIAMFRWERFKLKRDTLSVRSRERERPKEVSLGRASLENSVVICGDLQKVSSREHTQVGPKMVIW